MTGRLCRSRSIVAVPALRIMLTASHSLPPPRPSPKSSPPNEDAYQSFALYSVHSPGKQVACRTLRAAQNSLLPSRCSGYRGAIVQVVLALLPGVWAQHSTIDPVCDGYAYYANQDGIRQAKKWVCQDGNVEAVAWCDPGNDEKWRVHARKLELKRVIPFWGSYHHVEG